MTNRVNYPEYQKGYLAGRESVEQIGQSRSIYRWKGLKSTKSVDYRQGFAKAIKESLPKE